MTAFMSGVDFISMQQARLAFGAVFNHPSIFTYAGNHEGNASSVVGSLSVSGIRLCLSAQDGLPATATRAIPARTLEWGRAPPVVSLCARAVLRDAVRLL